MYLTLQEIKEAVGGTMISDNGYIYQLAAIDSRNVKGGELFFALKGSATDGHLYIDDAVKRGAKGIVVSDNELALYWRNKVGVILVNNTLEALHTLANYVRKTSKAVIVCITGSMGKTTTKDYAAQLIFGSKKAMKTEGNLNSITGLPLSLIRMKPDCEIAILEMATNKKGEIRKLAKISQPDIGVILNIAEVHIEYFGTLDEIAREKLSLVEELSEGSILIYNNDDEYLRKANWSRKCSYGIEQDSDIMIRDLKKKEVGFEGYFCEGSLKHHFTFSIRGRWNLYNLLAAVSIARKVGLYWEEIIDRIKVLNVSEKRGEIINLKNGVKIIDESYNSNPRSLLLIMRDFSGMNVTGRKVAIVGDMLELGEHAEKFHHEVIEEISLMNVDVVISIGLMMREAIRNLVNRKREVKVSFIDFSDNEECFDFLKDFLKPGDIILVKGSRGIKLDEIIENLKKFYGVMD